MKQNFLRELSNRPDDDAQRRAKHAKAQKGQRRGDEDTA
jgi:hypothetical protein